MGRRRIDLGLSSLHTHHKCQNYLCLNNLNKEMMMTIIPKNKIQLIALLNKQQSVRVLGIYEGKPAAIIDQIKSIKESTFTVIVIKS